MDGRSDEALVAAAQTGDRDALEALLRRHHARIWAVCRRLAGNDADAADATQEALLRIVRRLDTFDGRSRFTTWAHRVATNACLDELRRRGRRRAEPLPEDGHVTTDVPGLGTTASSRLDLDAALAQLPEEFRVAVVLRDVAGHDYAEIAAILDLPPGTVRSRIARGRARLADLLDPPESARAGNRAPSSQRPIDGPTTAPPEP